MNIFKEYYLRLFRGYWKMDKIDIAIIKLHYWLRDDGPTIIPVKNYFLVSKPKGK